MADYKDILFAKAFRIVHGTEFNKVFSEIRTTDSAPLIYEVVLKENEPWEHLRDTVYPKLARYLKAKGVNPSSGEGFIAAVFFKNFVYLIDGKEFLKIFCEMEGLNFPAFHFRTLRWLAE